jgi:hypothetical protein
MDETTPTECNCCGGKLPTGWEDDTLDRYLTNDGYCPGHLTVDADGEVLGCGAWSPAAYRPL